MLLKKTVNLLLWFLISQNTFAATSLWFTEIKISLRFNVDNISYQQLQKKQSGIDNNIILFDIRRPEEYQQSRIKESIQVDPDMTADDFMILYGNKLFGKELIFYCSVGYRSSEFIQRIEQQAKLQGAKNLYNLKGGIFRWYNENLPVLNDHGETDDIHPYDASWSNLIEIRKDK